MPGDALELAEACERGTAGVVRTRQRPPVFLLGRRRDLVFRIGSVARERLCRTVVVTLVAELMEIRACNLSAIANEMDELRIRKQLGEFRDKPRRLVGGIAPMARAAI